MTSKRFMELYGNEHGFQVYQWKPRIAMLQEWDLRPPAQPADQLQNLIWSNGINCDVDLVVKTDNRGNEFVSARLKGSPEEEQKAAPIAQQWVNRLWEKQYARRLP
jgi:hypothetical protein